MFDGSHLAWFWLRLDPRSFERTLGHTPTTSKGYSKISNAACSITISNNVVLDLTFLRLTPQNIPLKSCTRRSVIFRCSFRLNTLTVFPRINLVPQFQRLLRQQWADTASKVYCIRAQTAHSFTSFHLLFLTMIFYMKVFKQYTNYD